MGVRVAATVGVRSRSRSTEAEAIVVSLGLHIAQSRYYLQTLDPEVGNICILEALGYVEAHSLRRRLLQS